MHHGVLDPGTEFIQKPFSPQALGLKVQEVLGRVAAGQPDGP
jgi:DNA-binding response OmpR family regulator